MSWEIIRIGFTKDVYCNIKFDKYDLVQCASACEDLTQNTVVKCLSTKFTSDLAQTISLMKILFQNKNQNSKVYELQRKTVTLWSENNTPTFHPNFFYMNDVHYKIFNMENLTATQLMWSSVRSWVSYNHWILWRLNSFWILRVPIFPTTSKHNIHDVSMHIYIHCNLYPWKHSNLYPWN